jgi:glycosyltransferase involved in cell wall biosynthesis
MAKGLSRFFVRRALKEANQVAAVSEFAKGILSNNGIVRSVFAIPNGVNLPEKMTLRERHSDKLVLITIGSVTRRKGQHNVVAALPDMIRRFGNVEYHMVGIPRDRDKIEGLTHKLGISDCVFLHGAVSDEERDKLILQADIFIMLSENLPDGDVEGFGIAVLEANSFGLPAIGSRNTGIEQAISHGSSGCLVDARNSDDICDSIELILADYSKFSQGAIAWARQHEWNKIGDRYLALMEGVDRA